MKIRRSATGPAVLCSGPTARRLVLVTALSSALLALVCPSGALAAAARAGRLEARVIDGDAKQPTAARVAITTLDGKFVEIEGAHPHVDCLGKRWCYVDGDFSAKLLQPEVLVEIRHGLDTTPVLERIKASSSGVVTKTFQLQRWYRRANEGYLAGDIHAHLPVPAEAAWQMRAEDLDAQVLLHMADSQYQIPTNALFTGRLDVHSRPGAEIYVGQEIRDWHMGHLTLLRLKELVPGFPDMGGGLEYWRSEPHLDLTRAARGARERGGLVVWSHFCSVPGAESPVLAALGLLDAIELVTWNDPTQLPNHFSPWAESGFSQAEFPVMRAVDLYYTLLNTGLRLPVAAGTDKFGEDIPLGSNRTYARIEGAAPGFDAWLDAVKAGRTFVSNGPIIEFTVDGQRPGDVVAFTGRREVKIRARARSILQFTELDIVVNGRVVAHRMAHDLAADKGLYSMEVETTVPLDTSSWVAARVAEHPDVRRYILPRGLSVFAHTSPVYFLRDGQPVREPASLAYMQKYVKGLIHWLDRNPAFRNPSDAAAARQSAQAALAFYEGT